MMPSAMGERTALWSQQKSTDWGSSCTIPASAPEMQNADQGEQAPRGVIVDTGLALKPFFKDARALVVDATAGHVDGFDLARRHVLDRIEIAFADRPVILDHLPEGRQREVKLRRRLVAFGADVKDQPLLANGQRHAIRPFGHLSALPFGERERVLFDQIEHRHLALLL